jgi:hypothetical protein
LSIGLSVWSVWSSVGGGLSIGIGIGVGVWLSVRGVWLGIRGVRSVLGVGGGSLLSSLLGGVLVFNINVTGIGLGVWLSIRSILLLGGCGLSVGSSVGVGSGLGSSGRSFGIWLWLWFNTGIW